MLSMIARSPMVHVQVPETCIHFSFMYTAYYILPVLTIKEFIKKYGDPTTPFKLATDMKPSISYLRVLFFSMCYNKIYCKCWEKFIKHVSPSAKVFRGLFCWYSTESKSVFCLCTKQTRDILFLQCFFNDSFSSALAYTSQPYE